MTSGFKTFGRNVYGFTDMEVGETKAFPCATELEGRRVRKAAHNQNMRGLRYFTTRYKDGVLYVTRIR